MTYCWSEEPHCWLSFCDQSVAHNVIPSILEFEGSVGRIRIQEKADIAFEQRILIWTRIEVLYIGILGCQFLYAMKEKHTLRISSTAMTLYWSAPLRATSATWIAKLSLKSFARAVLKSLSFLWWWAVITCSITKLMYETASPGTMPRFSSSSWMLTNVSFEI